LATSISKSEIKIFQTKLLDWFVSNGRIFLWRQDGLTSYEIIIAEVLLQRTKAETIEKFYANFLTNYPNWEVLVNTSITDIEIALKPIGLYKQRAKRLQSLAVELSALNGLLPENREDLDKISMFGQYIANAVELQIFMRPKPLLDVNMARVLERYFGPRQLADIRYDPYLQNLSHQVVSHENSKQINWAILDFAALICKRRNPKCVICFLSVDCKYYKLFAIK
jgi:A/G-specific adenine glycosylase